MRGFEYHRNAHRNTMVQIPAVMVPIKVLLKKSPSRLLTSISEQENFIYPIDTHTNNKTDILKSVWYVLNQYKINQLNVFAALSKESRFCHEAKMPFPDDRRLLFKRTKSIVRVFSIVFDNFSVPALYQTTKVSFPRRTRLSRTCGQS